MTKTTTISMAFPALYLYSFVKHVDNQRVDVAKHAPLLQNLQHSKVMSSEQS